MNFFIIVVYVNDANFIGTPIDLLKTIDCLNKEFEIGFLEEQSFVWDYKLHI